MKYLIVLLLICVALSGCLQEGERPNDTDNQNMDARFIGSWVCSDWAYTITFSKDNAYTSNFLGSGSWHTNNSELVLSENAYDYEFLGEKLHLKPLYLFFEKD